MLNKNSLGCKKGTAKQSRINAITEFDWYEQGLISSCCQADWNIAMINVLKQLVRTRTDIKLWPSEYNFQLLSYMVVKSVRRKVSQLDAASEAIDQRTLLYLYNYFYVCMIQSSSCCDLLE